MLRPFRDNHAAFAQPVAAAEQKTSAARRGNYASSGLLFDPLDLRGGRQPRSGNSPHHGSRETGCREPAAQKAAVRSKSSSEASP